MQPKHAAAAVGSFKDAELQNLRRIAALTPAQRVKMVCSMQKIVRRVTQARAAQPDRRRAK